MIFILGYPTGYSQPNTPNKWKRKKVRRLSTSHGEPLPESCITFRRHDADDLRQNDAAGEDIAGPSQGASAGRCSTQGAADY